MHAARPGSGQARTKILYLFRSPSHVQIGRKPLDPEVREALEHTHPDLTFDWNGLLRDSPVPSRQPRLDPRERDRAGRSGRPQKNAGRQSARPDGRSEPRPEARPPRAAHVPPSVPDDDSPLGQGLGAVEAARLRHRYAELAQRVGRRSRTPEERTRLTAELAAVNPDDWSGLDDIRLQARTADSRLDAIAAQLPRRRRGRRGGRSDGGTDEVGPDQTAVDDVIIGEREKTDEGITNDLQDPTPLVASDPDPAGDGDVERPVEAGADTTAVPEPPTTDLH